MSLIITLTEPTTLGGTDAYSLRAETINHSLTRYVMQTPFPATAVNTQGTVFILDLGSTTQVISVQGLVNVTSTGSGDPSKANLIAAIAAWWGYSNFSDATSLPTLSLGDSESYSVAIKQASFTKDGGLEDRWRFTLEFLVAA